MKTSIKVAIVTLTIGFSAFAATNALQAEPLTTSKGDRFLTNQAVPAAKIETQKTVHCPMMKEKVETTVRDSDSKGRTQVSETSKGLDANGCTIINKKDSGIKQTKSTMVCPDGTLAPAKCH